MKLTKRLMAVLLLVSLLASFVVPATFADTDQKENLIYDFLLYENEALLAVESAGTIGNANTTFNTAYDGTNRVYNWVVANYSTLGWGYENANGTNTAANKNFEFRNSGGANQGMRMLIPNAGQWAAIRIHVPTAGRYAIEAVAMQDNLAYTADMYIFPATTEYTSCNNRMSATDISSRMTAANKVGQVQISNEVHCRISDGYTFANPGDYVVVFAAPQEGIGNEKGAHLGALALLPVEEDPNETTAPSVISGTDVEYKFNLLVDYATQFGSQKNGTTLDKVESTLTELYPDTVNWNYADSSNGINKIQLRNNQGLRLPGEVGDWQAFRLSGITAGTYEISLESTGTSGMNLVSAYLVKAEAGVNIADAMTADNLLIAETQSTGGTYSPEAPVTLEDGEYFLIIKHTTIKTAKYVCLTNLSLKAVADAPEGTTVPEETTAPDTEQKSGFKFNLHIDYAEHFGSYPSPSNLTRVLELLDSLYPTTVNWNYENSTGGTDKIQIRNNQGLRLYGAVDDWQAFRLSGMTAGTYDFILNSQGNSTMNTVSAYLVKAAEGMNPADGIKAENLLLSGMQRTGTFTSTFTVPEDGEYFLIISHTAAGSSGYWCLTGLEITTASEPTEPEEAFVPTVDQNGIFDFNMVATIPELFGGMDGRGFHQKAIDEDKNGIIGDNGKEMTTLQYLTRLYSQKYMDWNYEASSFQNGKGLENIQFRAKQGLRIYGAAGDWVAFRLNVPAADTYNLLLTSGSSNSCNTMNIYLAEAAEGMDIAAAMTDANLLVSNALIDDKGTFYLGEYTFGNDEEYVLVFDFIKGTTMFLTRIEMTKDGLVADGTVNKVKTYNGTVYNLDLADQMDGIYTESRVDMPDVFDDMNARWAAGSLNWKFYNASEGLSGETNATKGKPTTDLRFYRTTGMRVYGKPDNWIALKIKSPGSGDFTITLNHGTCANSGTMALYVLPGDTDMDKLWQATDPENRVGKVILSNDTGDTKVEDGATSFVGYWNFEAGKEYILLLECYEPSPYNEARCYMHLSQIIMERGKIAYESAEAEKKVNSVTVIDNPLPIADACSTGALMDINGHDWYFLPIEGGYMLVYDLDTGKLMDKVYTGIARATETAVTKDQKLVIAKANCFVYDPYTGESYNLSNWKEVPGLESTNDPASLFMDADGKTMWMGSTYGAYLAKYDFETKEYTYLGQPYGYQNRITGIIVRDGYLYGCVHGDGVNKIFKWDIAAGKVVADYDVSDFMGTATYINSLNFLGDKYLAAAGANLTAAIVLNPETFEPVDLNMYAIPNLGITEEIDGKHYMVLQGYGLYEYDIATEVVSKVPGFDTSGIGFRTCGQNSFGKSTVTLDGETCLFTYTASGGHPRMFNMDKVEYQAWDNLVTEGGGGAPIRTILSWGEGSNRFSFGGFNTDLCAVYNTELGGIEFYYKTGGQTDSHIWYEGKLYAGNYSSTTLNEIYPDETMKTLPVTNEVIQRWQLNHAETGQKRVHILTAGDGYVFAGTTPDSNLNGGGITIYDTRTGRWKFHRSPVQNGSINGLAYHDKVLFGTTSGKGGSGALQEADYSAVIFAYDYEKQEVLATLDPRDYIKGLASPVGIIYGVTVDPNVEENGRIWSIVSDTLFCFTYDKETKTFNVQEVISYGKTTYTDSSTYGWWPRGIQFDTQRGRIYATFAQAGGSRCIEIEDMNAPVGQIKVKSHERFMGDIPQGNFYILGEDGNFYYGIAEDLKMFPLNVTDEDWAIAEKVDELILAIGDEITIESEAAIQTARSAYENLSWRYKALIQKLEILQEAESDILERKIDSYDGVEMTADHYPEMLELMGEYNGLNARQQRYVKNYHKLKTAFDAASALNDQRIAVAMQEKINALKGKFPLTLENEPEVLEIRAEYDALTAKQSVLVDATILLDAEAQIAALRAEYVKYVESLIQAIPDEITLEAEPAIVAAREAADKLYMNERKDVSYSKLTSAEGKLRTLKNAKAKAEEVDALIDAIGIVTLGDKDRIAAAREAYDSLNDTALQFVTKEGKLKTAEFILKALQSWGIPAIVIVDAGIVFAILWFVPSLHTKAFKTKKKEEAPSEG